MIEVHQKMDLEKKFQDPLKFAQLTKAAVNESQRWIELITGDRFKHHDNFIKSLQDGILLCRLINGLKPGSIRRTNQMHTSVAYLDNLSLFQSSCRDDFGLQEAQLFDIRDLDDLDIRGTMESDDDIQKKMDKRLRNVLVTLYWLGRVARPLQPDATLDLRTFESLVDPSYFDMTSLDDPNRPPCLIGVPSEAKNNKDDNIGSDKLEWESKFADRKDKKTGQMVRIETRQTAIVGNGCGQTLGKVDHHHHHEISRFIEEEDYDEAPPEPPNWETFPGLTSSFDDVQFFDQDTSSSSPPPSSSSSSASSFATKEFMASHAKTIHPPITQYLSSPTTALLSASPETLSHDSTNFDRLLRDMEKLSIVNKSLEHLEDFDEVGFEDDDDVGERKGDVVAGGSAEPSKLVRRKSDFLDELVTLDEATLKFDAPFSPTFDPLSPSPTPPSFPLTDRVVTLQSPELLEKPKSASATLVEVLHQNSFETWTTINNNNNNNRDIHSIMMERFAYDLENVLKVEHKGKVFDLASERKRMEEWNKKAEEKLKDKFEKDQDLLKEKLKEDLRRAHQMERMKQLQEEKFLEEEVIEVKNRKSLSKECSGSKFSLSSLSLFAPLPYKPRGIQSASPDLPNYTSLTDDWLSQSFSSELEKPSFYDTSEVDTSISPSFNKNILSPKPQEVTSDDAFEEPTWMRLTTEKVDKISILDVPANTATIEVLPDSLTTSSESIHSLRQSKEDVGGVMEDGGADDDVSKTDIQHAICDDATPFPEAPPIPARNDSLLVASDILVSREQAAYLSFDASIAKFTKSSSQPPASLLLTPSHRHDDTTLLTPSSDRCFEVCTYNPPSPITPHKRTTSSLSSVFPSPQSSTTERSDYLLMDGSSVDEAPPIRSVDYLFAYHDDQLKRRYYWTTSPVPSNHISPIELSSDPKIGSPVNHLEEKPSCFECGCCLALDQTITIFALKSRFHPECFKCKRCDAPLNADNVAIYQSIPHCFTCFNQLNRH